MDDNKKEVMDKFTSFEESLGYESGRIDGVIEGVKGVKKTATSNQKELQVLSRKAAVDNKALNDKMAVMDRDMKAHMRRLETQLASTSSASPAPGPSHNAATPHPSVRALTIDGIYEEPGENLIERCHDVCWSHMGLHYKKENVEECFRVGRDRDESSDSDTEARPRTVYVKFNDVNSRDLIIRRRFKLRGHRVYVNESHPHQIEQDRIRQYPIVRKARSMPEYKGRVQHVANRIIIGNTSYGVADFHRLPANLDPRYICTETRGDVTFFYKGESPLSNHHECKVNFRGCDYNCSEQAFFSAKATLCGDLDALEEIKKAVSPKLQKQIGGAIITCEDWEKNKFSVMTDICRDKFSQNPLLLKFLMETGQTYLCEDNPHCKVWGVGISRRHPDSDKVKDMPGNKMGKILMVIRQEQADAAASRQEQADAKDN
jgi:hypothetical protein